MAKLSPVCSTASTLALLVLVVFHLTVPCAESTGACSTSVGSITYTQNLGTLLAQMGTADISSFYDTSLGQAPDVAYLTAFCLVNVPISDCRTCLSGFADEAGNSCSGNVDAAFFSDNCTLRYSAGPIYGRMDNTSASIVSLGAFLPNATFTEYKQAVHSLLGGLPSRAAAGNSSIKFASAQAEYNSSITVYAAAQCTPDLTHQDCLQCLTMVVAQAQIFMSHSTGSAFYCPSCYVRFQDYNFYSFSAVGLPPAPAPSSTNGGTRTESGKGSTNAGTRSDEGTTNIIVAAVAVSLGILLV